MDELLQHLNAQLATTRILALNAQRYHWCVVGDDFYSYHKLFGKLYEAIDGTVDDLAERIRQLGGIPVTAPAQFEAFSVVPPSVPTPSGDPKAFTVEALAGQRAILAHAKAGIELAQRVKEWGVADLLTRNYQEHQKFEWFLRESAK